MIEQALREHLQEQASLATYLTEFNGEPAIFSQEAPADKAEGWAPGPQYGRIVFWVDLQGEPERTMGGSLTLDILCQKGRQFPEVIEPIVRSLIHGYFFSRDRFVVAAQWKDSRLFTEETDEVAVCTMTFALLAFPIISAPDVDVVDRFNTWSSEIDNLHVINYDALPTAAWKPSGQESAVYWRVAKEEPALWIPDTYQTIWRTATVKGHIFSETPAIANAVSRDLAHRLYAVKRLQETGEAPLMVNRRNTTDNGADPLRTGQVTCEATYGVIVAFEPDPDQVGVINNVNYT